MQHHWNSILLILVSASCGSNTSSVRAADPAPGNAASMEPRSEPPTPAVQRSDQAASSSLPVPASITQPAPIDASSPRFSVPLNLYQEFNDDSQQTRIEVIFKNPELAINITSSHARGFAGFYVDLPKAIEPDKYSALEYVSPPIASRLPLEVKLEADNGHRQCFIYRRKPAQDLPRTSDGKRVRLMLAVAGCDLTQPIDRLTFAATPSAGGREGWPATPQRLQFTISDVAFVP